MMKRIRDHLGMTQFEFAIKLGVTPTTISRWEGSQANPQLSIDQLKIISQAIGPEKTIEDFFEWKNMSTNKEKGDASPPTLISLLTVNQLTN